MYFIEINEIFYVIDRKWWYSSVFIVFISNISLVINPVFVSAKKIVC